MSKTPCRTSRQMKNGLKKSYQQKRRETRHLVTNHHSRSPLPHSLHTGNIKEATRTTAKLRSTIIETRTMEEPSEEEEAQDTSDRTTTTLTMVTTTTATLPSPSSMNSQTNTNIASLRIWQENLNKSATAQHCILSGPFTAKEWDIIAIQEPVIDNLGNTKATPDWNVIYPTQRFTHQARTRAVTLIHKRLNTNNWRQIPFPSTDVVIVQLTGPFGHVTIINIYDDSKIRSVIPSLTTFLSRELHLVRPSPSAHML